MCLEKQQGYFSTRSRGAQCREKYFTEKISELHINSVLSLSTTLTISFLLPTFIIQLCNNIIPKISFLNGHTQVVWKCFSNPPCGSSQKSQLSYLKHSNLLPIPEQAEGQGMLRVQPQDDFTATEWDRNYVCLQVCPVLVENEFIVLHSAPALTPTVVREHVEISCNKMKYEIFYSSLFLKRKEKRNFSM